MFTVKLLIFHYLFVIFSVSCEVHDEFFAKSLLFSNMLTAVVNLVHSNNCTVK